MAKRFISSTWRYFIGFIVSSPYGKSVALADIRYFPLPRQGFPLSPRELFPGMGSPKWQRWELCPCSPAWCQYL